MEAKERIRMIHSRISNKVIPKVDMKFETEEEAYDFYNPYAYKVRFGICKNKGQKDTNDRIIGRTFLLLL